MKKVFLKSIFRIMVFLNLVLLLGACATNSCNSNKEKTARLTSEDRLVIELIDEYRKTLSELSSEKEDTATLMEIGKLYFHIGNLSKDRESIGKAVDIFNKVLKKEPENAEIRAYLGSSYTIKARDFPLKWIANITPLGFVRIYYTKKGTNSMDEAVEMDSLNPAIRLIRGIACVNMPKFFSQFDKGIRDFELLLSWIMNPYVNKKYLGMLTDKDFTAIVYYHTAEAYLIKDEKEKADALFKMAASMNSDSPFSRAASSRLNEL